MKKKDLIELVIKVLPSMRNGFNYKQVAGAAEIKKKSDRNQIAFILEDLVQQGLIEEVGRGKYKVLTRKQTITGKITRNGNGKTHLIPDDGGDKIFIADRNVNTAMKNDRVSAFLYAKRAHRETEAEVVEILERARVNFVGVLSLTNNLAFVIVDNRILSNDIFVPLDKVNGAKDGEKVVVKMTDWPQNAKNPFGEIKDVLGDVGDNNTEMHAILADFGLPYSYPEDVAALADKIDEKISKEEMSKRKDVRKITTFTIDPFDAKDFDDALSYRKLKNGNVEIGVHIADVSHYVKPGGAIDIEGYDRATSVYLVDRTIPMLPDRLCNQICSLRPNEEKLTYSVYFELDDYAILKDYEIAKSVILSDRRFTYEEAQEIIETEEGDFAEELLQMNQLAKKMRDVRMKNGAIAFDRQEVRFKIDDDGKPLSVYSKEMKDSNKLVEEFMLLANRKVAEHIGKLKRGQKAKTFIYRIHEEPNPQKLSNFSQFIKKFGYKFAPEGSRQEISSALNKLLRNVEGKREENLIETLAVRSMSKAIYTTKNIGHYGLAFDHYTHFTSPIRRYPDIMVHRLLNSYEEGAQSANSEEYEKYCSHCSDREQLAASAERASIKYKQVEFMLDKKGQVFDGVISGVTEWGLYVELVSNKCEGMIPIRNLGDDFYTYDEKNYCIKGRRTGRKYQLGDELHVKVGKANLEKKQLDFELV